jgi:hypothetical protein
MSRATYTSKRPMCDCGNFAFKVVCGDWVCERCYRIDHAGKEGKRPKSSGTASMVDSYVYQTTGRVSDDSLISYL